MRNLSVGRLELENQDESNLVRQESADGVNDMVEPKFESDLGSNNVTSVPRANSGGLIYNDRIASYPYRHSQKDLSCRQPKMNLA